MNKEQIQKQLLREFNEREALEKQRRNAAYTTAHLDDAFVKLDQEVRRLTSELGRGVKPKSKEAELIKALEIAKTKRNNAFEKCYKSAKQPTFNLANEVKNKLIELSGIPYSQIKQTPPTGLEKPYTLLSTFAGKFPNVKKNNIILTGATGTGKTYAIQSLGKQLLDNNHSVLYITAFSMVTRFKQYIFDKDESAFNDMLDCDILIIDDLGTEPVIRNITDEYLYNLINERYVGGKSFIITTNLDKQMMTERYGDRISSRIFAKDTTAEIKLTGADLRQ